MSDLSTYRQFIASKGTAAGSHGFNPAGRWQLFPHQLATLEFACQKGRSAAFLDTGEPVLFDPAVYHGDRETDLAMTELFGGFPRAFYDGYREIAPIDAGYTARRDLYNLYHVLNHANLFGRGYAQQAERMMERLLAAAR